MKHHKFSYNHSIANNHNRNSFCVYYIKINVKKLKVEKNMYVYIFMHIKVRTLHNRTKIDYQRELSNVSYKNNEKMYHNSTMTTTQ